MVVERKPICTACGADVEPAALDGGCERYGCAGTDAEDQDEMDQFLIDCGMLPDGSDSAVHAFLSGQRREN